MATISPSRNGPTARTSGVVLIITGDVGVAGELKGLLEGEGFGCVHLRDPQRALAHGHLIEADMILLGLEAEGAVVCSRLRAIDTLTEVPIFVVGTEGATEIDVLRALHAGADDYLPTPLRGAVVAAKVSAAVKRYRKARRAAMRIKPGMVIDARYRVLGRIGRGGMGIVYLVQDEREGALRALKVLRIKGRVDFGESVRERFAREVEILMNVRHRGVIGVHDASFSPQLSYYVMDYVPSGSLCDLVERRGALPPVEALRLVAKIADALHAAHGNGVVHRDLKSENVLFDRDGEPIITDFGLALARDGRGRLTTDGFSVGSIPYMSPEQLADPESIDARSDVFALGVLLYEMLVGRTPFADDADGRALVRRINEDPAPPSAADPAIPKVADSICMRALSRQRDWRFQSAADLAAQASVAADRIEAGDGSADAAALHEAETRRIAVRSAIKLDSTMLKVDRPSSSTRLPA